VSILDPEVLFEQVPQLQGAKVDISDAVVNLLEADVLPDAGDAHVDAPPVPEAREVQWANTQPRNTSRSFTAAGQCVWATHPNTPAMIKTMM
jgi:hypothetical protein